MAALVWWLNLPCAAPHAHSIVLRTLMSSVCPMSRYLSCLTLIFDGNPTLPSAVKQVQSGSAVNSALVGIYKFWRRCARICCWSWCSVCRRQCLVQTFVFVILGVPPNACLYALTCTHKQCIEQVRLRGTVLLRTQQGANVRLGSPVRLRI